MEARLRTRQRWIIGALLTAGVALVISGCGGGGDSGTGAVTKGGTLRLGTLDFGFTDGFDPTGEYLGLAWSYYGNLLTRNLVGYSHRPGPAGTKIVPDLATEVPQPTGNGTIYTFKLKQGIKFGPPLNREITSKDIEFAFERIGTPSLSAAYDLYFINTIEGLADFKAGRAKTISGIQTPDRKTITFKLTQPTGDFLYRLALPAAGAIPREVAGCFKNAGDYGRYVISSGPYMIEGSDKLDASSCKTLKPIAGYNPKGSLVFVRNPSYDPATDSPDDRSNNLDRISVVVIPNANDIFDKIVRGELDGSPDTPSNDVIARFAADDKLKKDLKIFPGSRTWFMSMNLTIPPFDDVHVRRAVNYAIDRADLQKSWGGPNMGAIATHAMPDALYAGGKFPPDYNPFPHDPTKAAGEMKRSRYDANKDGVCDAPVCKNILHVTRDLPQWTSMAPKITAALAGIGLVLNTRELPTVAAYTATDTIANNVPIASNAGWTTDYADGYALIGENFDGRSLVATDNTNRALVGITPSQAAKFGIELPPTPIPSINADIDACLPKTGDARTNCWIALDKKVTERVVPWVPYLFANSVEIAGPSMSNYVYDQATGEMAFSHITVDRSKQK